MQMSPKIVNYGGKNLGFGDGRFFKNVGFGVSFGYRNNTKNVSRDAHLAMTVSTMFEVDTTIRFLVITLLRTIHYVTL